MQNEGAETSAQRRTLANDFTARDSKGATIAYVRQKIMKLRGEIDVYNNENKSEVLYKINADKIIGFNMNYAFTSSDGDNIGRVSRKGMGGILLQKRTEFSGIFSTYSIF